MSPLEYILAFWCVLLTVLICHQQGNWRVQMKINRDVLDQLQAQLRTNKTLARMADGDPT